VLSARPRGALAAVHATIGWPGIAEVIFLGVMALAAVVFVVTFIKRSS
jgi:hypothetical protein